MAEDATNSALLVDRGLPIANDSQSDGRRALRVLMSSAGAPADYDTGTCTQVDPSTHRYQFYKGATLLKTVVLTFANPTPITLTSWTLS